MKTGEGKTLTSTMPVYLNAFTGKGVHVVTVNEYLASRDATEMGQLYKFLRINSWIEFKQSDKRRKARSVCCVILRMVRIMSLVLIIYVIIWCFIKNKKYNVHLYYAVIDEVDSILIDEARTPLIISGQHKSQHNFIFKQMHLSVR